MSIALTNPIAGELGRRLLIREAIKELGEKAILQTAAGIGGSTAAATAAATVAATAGTVSAGLTIGTGLGGIISGIYDALQGKDENPYAEIPGFATSELGYEAGIGLGNQIGELIDEFAPNIDIEDFSLEKLIPDISEAITELITESDALFDSISDDVEGWLEDLNKQASQIEIEAETEVEFIVQSQTATVSPGDVIGSEPITFPAINYGAYLIFGGFGVYEKDENGNGKWEYSAGVAPGKTFGHGYHDSSGFKSGPLAGNGRLAYSSSGGAHYTFDGTKHRIYTNSIYQAANVVLSVNLARSDTFFSSRPFGYLGAISAGAILSPEEHPPLKEPYQQKIQEILVPIEKDKMAKFKCDAYDAAKALAARVEILETEMFFLKTALGKKIESITVINFADGETEEIPVDGISGAISLAAPAAINANSKLGNTKITEIETPSGETENVDGIGGAVQLGAKSSVEINDKLGAKVIEIETPSGETENVDGIGGAVQLGAKNSVEINDKLGPKIEEIETYNPDTNTLEKVAVAGGIAGATAVVASNIGQFRQKFEKVRKWLMSGRILDILTFASSLHNAHQLSSSVIDLIISSAENVLNVVGIDDDEGHPIDIREQLNNSIENLMVSVFGQEAYDTAVIKWYKFNRIYQSSSNLLSNITSLFNTLEDTTETIGSYVGTIGNALKRYRIVGDNAYQWLAEKFTAKNRWQRRLNAVVEGLETAENVTSSLEQVTSNVLEVTQLSQEIYTESAELKRLLSESSPKEPDKEFAKNQAIKSDQTAKQEASEPPPVTRDDINQIASID